MMAEKKIPTRPSSQVEEGFYDDETQKMRIVFKSGAEYIYSNVDQDMADAMADTPWNDLKPLLLDYQKIG
jgi:KTSC domain